MQARCVPLSASARSWAASLSLTSSTSCPCCSSALATRSSRWVQHRHAPSHGCGQACIVGAQCAASLRDAFHMQHAERAWLAFAWHMQHGNQLCKRQPGQLSLYTAATAARLRCNACRCAMPPTVPPTPSWPSCQAKVWQIEVVRAMRCDVPSVCLYDPPLAALGLLVSQAGCCDLY